MKITDVPFAVLRFQYQLARFPLQLVEHRVFDRMDTEAPARLLYERSIGMLDRAVGTALGDQDVERRGEALLERSAALSRAATLDTAAVRAVKEAESDVADARDAAALVRKQARAEKQDEAVAARADAAHAKVAAIKRSGDRVANAAKQADKAAAARKNAAEAAKRDEQAKIRAAEKSVTAVAEAKAEDAQGKRSAAALKEAQADRVEQLTDEEHDRRKEGTDDA
jgi:hypothetical protein